MGKNNNTSTVRNKSHAKPGYKHTPLGWIPEEWEILDFDECIEIRNGQVDPKLEIYKEYILIAPNHIESSTGRLLSIETANVQNAISGKYFVSKGDVIYSKIRPYLKKATIAPFDCLCSADMYSLRGKSSITQAYILSIVLSERFTHLANKASARTGIPKVNREEISSIPIALPPIHEQNKISNILSTWDDGIQKTQQLIDQLKLRNKGLMQELLTPKSNWRKYRIGDLLQENKRQVNWNDGEMYHLISVRRRSGGAFYRESLLGKQILTKQLYTALEGDFLISKMQIVHGASAVVPAELSGMKISGSYISVRSKDDNLLDINYFNWLSKTKEFYRMAYVSSYGVHIEKMTFDFDDFKRRLITIPSDVKEQYKIHTILSLAYNEINLLEQRLAVMQTQKKGLMQKLLRGNIRVKT